MAEELNNDLRLQRSAAPSRIERKIYQPEEDVDSTESIESTHSRPSIFNFTCMIVVGSILDLIGFFSSEIPGVGATIVFVADMIFIPWFHFSGMKFTNKRIIATAAQTIGESIPFVGNLPLITINIIYSYYSN